MRLLNIQGVGDARLDEYERPAAGPKDVVIRMKACGICGSDLSYIKIGGIPMPGTHTPLGHRGGQCPQSCEFGGVHLGKDRNHRWPRRSHRSAVRLLRCYGV